MSNHRYMTKLALIAVFLSSSVLHAQAEEQIKEVTPPVKVYDPARWPLDRTVGSWIALKLLEKDKKDMLEWHLRETYWASIVDLDRYLQSPELDQMFAKQAKSALIAAAAYFKQHPMKPVKPEAPKIAEQIKKGWEDRERNRKGPNQKQDIEDEMHQAISGLGIFEGLDDVAELMIAQTYLRYLQTQAIIDRINAEPAGTDQPATKPTEKVPAEVQPPPPTSKDGHQ